MELFYHLLIIFSIKFGRHFSTREFIIKKYLTYRLVLKIKNPERYGVLGNCGVFYYYKKRKDGFTKMKNKLTALVVALLLSISMLHTEVYASTNPDSNNPLADSENVKREFDVSIEESESSEFKTLKDKVLIHPTDPDVNNWWN